MQDEAVEKSAVFTDLLHESRSRVYGYIYALVQNRDDAEDVFQETTLRLWEKFDEFELGTDFGRWASRVARLTVLNFVRRHRRRRRFFSDELLDQIAKTHQREATQLTSERTQALTHCVERLGASDRELIETCYAGDRSIKEIARMQGRTADAIYQALSRIRRALLACVERTLVAEGR
jgi:RNA polymerase sigma-70 factor, ECF subfamily